MQIHNTLPNAKKKLIEEQQSPKVFLCLNGFWGGGLSKGGIVLFSFIFLNVHWEEKLTMHACQKKLNSVAAMTYHLINIGFGQRGLDQWIIRAHVELNPVHWVVVLIGYHQSV